MLTWFRKLFRLKDRTIFNQPFLVARRPAVHVSNGESIDIELICPSCQSHWADATVTFGAPITPDNFRLREPFKEAKIPEDKQPSCPACGWGYTVWAMQALVLAAMNRQNFVQKQGEKTKQYGQSNSASS